MRQRGLVGCNSGPSKFRNKYLYHSWTFWPVVHACHFECRFCHLYRSTNPQGTTRGDGLEREVERSLVSRCAKAGKKRTKEGGPLGSSVLCKEEFIFDRCTKPQGAALGTWVEFVQV